MSTEAHAATAFEKSPGWLDYCPNPSRPQLAMPVDAVDAHCHVFGPGAVFPYSPRRKYTPCDAPKEKLFALRDFLGFRRNVIVQASCHGTDNRALLDALQAAGDRARGVACVDSDVSDADLRAMHAAGVRGVRFNFIKRLVDFTSPDAVRSVAGRIAKLGWHTVVYFDSKDLPELTGLLTTLPTPVVIDHMGRPDVARGVNGAAFTRLLDLMSGHPNIWIKVNGAERLSVSGPHAVDGERRPYRDVVPFGRRLVERFPERVLWGTDWPHPNLKSHMPDDGLLVDSIAQIAPTPELQHRLLVENPHRLYWPTT